MKITFEDMIITLSDDKFDIPMIQVSCEYEVSTKNFGEFGFRSKLNFRLEDKQLCVFKLSLSGKSSYIPIVDEPFDALFGLGASASNTDLISPNTDEHLNSDSWSMKSVVKNQEIYSERMESIEKWWKDNTEIVRKEVINHKDIFNKRLERFVNAYQIK